MEQARRRFLLLSIRKEFSLPLANKEKPPILRRPRQLLMLVGALLALLFVVYLATAATGFLRTQTKTPDARMTGAEAPLERAM
ncbi:hypothetical protein CD944_12115 [Brevundimonas diminuta]|jgi:hypothetical protein|nr:hypothetical protein BDIM_07050 [Brevundimonas diminuta ATCC 11568]OMG57757.1 hypothetical protein BJP32_11265 [Brevundimonas sp. ZS04]OWR18166.1 hypothetical protein CD944_12115 [Brevundimonas diminuta]